VVDVFYKVARVCNFLYKQRLPQCDFLSVDQPAIEIFKQTAEDNGRVTFDLEIGVLVTQVRRAWRMKAAQ